MEGPIPRPLIVPYAKANCGPGSFLDLHAYTQQEMKQVTQWGGKVQVLSQLLVVA